MSEYRIIAKLSLSAVENPSKKVKAVMSFISASYQPSGLNIPFTRIEKEFAKWNEITHTVDASSLDLHKVFFTACFLFAKHRVQLSKLQKRELTIPYFFKNKDDVSVMQTRKTSEFEDLYYETLDHLKELEQKEQKEQKKQKEQDPTQKIIELIKAQYDNLDIEALKLSLDGIAREKAASKVA